MCDGARFAPEGRGELFAAEYDSPIGRLTLAAGGEGLVGLWLEDQKYFGSGLAEKLRAGRGGELDAAAAWLDRYFAGERPLISELRLAPRGSDFRRTVWALLCAIPYGETVTYGELAARTAAKLGRERMSAQAVGGAVGHNPISVIIPCHRVVGADGSLTGYAGGTDRKLRLLQHEGADAGRLFIPKRGTAL